MALPIGDRIEIARVSSLGRASRQRVLRGMLVSADLLMLIAATWVASEIAFPLRHATASEAVRYAQIELALPLLAMVILWFEGLYDLDRIFWGSGEFSRVARGLSLGVVGLILALFALKMEGLSRLWTVLLWVLMVAFVCLGRFLVRTAVAALRRRGYLLKPTLVVGSNTEAEDLLRLLDHARSAGIRPVACLASSRAERLALNFISDVPCIGAARDVRDIVSEHHIDTVVIASSAFDHDVLARIVADLRDLDVDVHISSGLMEVLTRRVLVREMGGVPLITVKGVSLSRINIMTKRAFDVAVAGTIVVAGLPLWAVLAALIKLTSPGPVFYGQERIGKDGTPFMMLKFRSMVADADAQLAGLSGANEASGPLFKMRDDPRVTPIGRWMRKFSIDEFPQLINVLRGDMSCVGPRPPLPHETKRYTKQDWRRLEALPGMTGLWQVSGRSNLTFAEMVRLDLFYIENWSVTFDLALLARTVPAVLGARGAY